MPNDQTSGAAEAYARELDAAEKRFDEALKLRTQKKTSLLSQFPLRSLTWLALAPIWPRRLVERGFPGQGGDLVSGEKATENLKQISDRRIGEFGTADDASGELFTMSSAQRSAVLDFLQTLPDDEIQKRGVRSYILKQLTDASRIMLDAGKSGDVALAAPLRRWASLASRADSEEGIARFLNERVEESLAAAREIGQIVSPEALRWVEAAAPFVNWLGSVVEWGVVRACRRIELFYREAYDDRSLKNYFVRDYQEEIFTQLLPEDPAKQKRRKVEDTAEQWALHYVGLGGTGKTMLMRRISAQLAEKMNLAVARIDFDRLNPDYPARAPGLLLMGFAEELRLHARDTSSDLFERFDKEVEHLHQKIKAGYDAHNPQSVTGDDSAFRSVLRPFIQAVATLAERKRVVLVLDTCEELAKLRSDGSLPNSVRVTFEILERIHEQLPSLRVIFAGRRPLASAGHLLPEGSEKRYNWTCPVSKLPPRDYLRLYEIRGFTEEEANKFLAQYSGEKGAQVKPELFSAILSQSCSADKTFDSRFEWNDGRVESADSRYNPYDLDMFAEWVCADPNVGEAEINAGATQYVKDRIMKRLDPHIKNLLPEIVLLGRFDEKMMRQLIDAKRENFDPLFSELISQEWLDVDRNATITGTVWAIDNIMRKRLYNYYESEEASMFAKAKRFIADFLYDLTLKREWTELSTAYFDAALRAFTHNKKRTAEWWEQIEKQLAEDGQWTWAKELTDQLLAEDGPVFRADPTAGTQLADESVLRPAVLATQAAAITHLIGTTPDIDGSLLLGKWSEVLEKVDRHPDAEGSLQLKHRAVTGKFAALRWHPELCSPSVLDEWDKSFEQLPQLDVTDERTAASRIAMLEALVEICEDLSVNSALTENDKKRLVEIYFNCYEEPWLSFLPDDLRVFFITLGGRLQKLCGMHRHAVETFNEALERNSRMSAAQSLPHRLDWHRPEDFGARITLECVRGLYPSYSDPESVLASVESQRLAAEGTETLDADRLASLITQIRGYADVPASYTSGHDLIKRSISVQRIRPTCSAHRQVPAHFLSLLESDFSHARINEAIEKCLEIAKQGENSSAIYLQKTAERALFRMAVRSHLRDERGMIFGDSLAKAEFESLDDINLRFHAYALDGLRSNATLNSYFQPGMDDQRRASLFHIGWRSGKGPPATHSGFESGRIDVNATFTEFSLALDVIENKYLLAAGRKPSDDGPKVPDLVDASCEWAKANGHQPVQALTLLLRSLVLNSQPAAIDNILAPIVKKMGALRAAEIALEEGTLLALRMPARAIPLLVMAHEWYQQSQDFFGQFVTTVRTAMLYAATQKKDELSKSLRAMKIEYQVCYEFAAKSELPSWELMETLLSEGNKSKVSEGITSLLTGLDALRSWRPLIVRVLGCMIREREFTAPQAASDALMTWVRSNYSTTINEEQQVIPPDLTYLFSYKEESVIIQERPPLVSKILSFVKAATPIVVGIAIVLVGYLAMARFVQYLISFVTDISAPLSLIITLGVIALLSQVSAMRRCVVTLWTRRILVRNVGEVKDLNRPLLSPLKLEAWSGVVSYDITLSTINPKSDDSYRELAEVVPQKLRKKWEKTNRWARDQYIHTKIVVDETNCAAPWEAIRGLPSEDIWTFQKSRILARRDLTARDVTRLDKVMLPVQIVTLASSVSQIELAQNSWRMNETRVTPEYFSTFWRKAGVQMSGLKAIYHVIDRPDEYLGGVTPEFSVVHIIGSPSQTSSGVRLEIQGAERLLDDIDPVQQSGKRSSSRVESRNQPYFLSGEEVARVFPRLRICVVQCDAVTDNSRNTTTRYEAALLRRFGAELYKCGIPAVILLPPLPEDVAAAAIQKLTNMILLEVERGPRRWHKKTPLAKTVRAMQDEIAKAYDDNEKAIEIAFDVCLYMEDDFDFDIAEMSAAPKTEQLPSQSQSA